MSKNISFPHTVTIGSASVKVYKTPTRTSPECFTVAYYEGRRLVRTTLVGETRALAAAKKLATRLNAARDPQGLGISPQDYAEFLAARRMLQTQGVSLLEAVNSYRDASETLQGKPLGDAVKFYVTRHPLVAEKTVEECVNLFTESRRAALRSEVYLGDLRYRFAAFTKAFKGPIGMVTGEDMRAFFAALKVGARSKNNYLGVYKAFYNWLRKVGYVPKDHDVLGGIERIKVTTEILVYTPSELAQLLEHCPSVVRPVIALGGFAGIRTAEIERLDWKNVGQKYIEVGSAIAKTRARRLVPIAPNLERWLRPYRQKTGRVWEHSAAYMKECFATAALQAGLKWKRNGLRHGYVSNRLALTKDENATALESGHTVKVLYTNYRLLVDEDSAKHYFSIEPPAESNIIPFGSVA